MTSFILACTLWGAPNIELVEIPVSEYAMAEMNKIVGPFQFEASVMEESLNYIKITHLATQASTQTSATSAYGHKSLSLRMDIQNNQASLDCDVKEKQN